MPQYSWAYCVFRHKSFFLFGYRGDVWRRFFPSPCCTVPHTPQFPATRPSSARSGKCRMAGCNNFPYTGPCCPYARDTPSSAPVVAAVDHNKVSGILSPQRTPQRGPGGWSRALFHYPSFQAISGLPHSARGYPVKHGPPENSLSHTSPHSPLSPSIRGLTCDRIPAGNAALL